MGWFRVLSFSVAFCSATFVLADQPSGAHGGGKVTPGNASPLAVGSITNKYKSVTCTAKVRCSFVGSDYDSNFKPKMDRTFSVGAMQPEGNTNEELTKIARKRLENALGLVVHTGSELRFVTRSYRKMETPITCEDLGTIECKANPPGDILDVYNETFRPQAVDNLHQSLGLEEEHGKFQGADFLKADPYYTADRYSLSEAKKVPFEVPEKIYCYYVVGKARPYLSGSLNGQMSSSSGSGAEMEAIRGFFSGAAASQSYSLS